MEQGRGATQRTNGTLENLQREHQCMVQKDSHTPGHHVCHDAGGHAAPELEDHSV